KVYDEIKNKPNIKVKYIGTYNLKNDTKPREIYAIANTRLKVPERKDLDNITEDRPDLQKKPVSSPHEQKPPVVKKRFNLSSPRVGLTILFSLMSLAFGSFLFISLKNNQKVQWARQEALPKIQRLIDKKNSKEAFELALKAEKYIPNDSMLLRLWPKMSRTLSLITDPPGAMIYNKSIVEPESDFKLLGPSPLTYRTYWDYSVWKIEKPGCQTRKFLCSAYELNNETLKLLKSDSFPENTVLVPFHGWQYRPFASLALLKYHNNPDLNDFIMDKYEVTNKEFKVFVDNGGYRKKEYWDYSIRRFDQILTWEEAMNFFIDQTGQKGPIAWEVGDYPEGKGNYPVSGVSWYEAMAYTKFAEKSLPTVYHWMYAATPLLSDYISPNSNFSKERFAPVGSYKGIGLFGTYDMAGNVREWCRNIQSSNGKAFILGGGWSDNPYTYNIAYAQDPFNRSSINGFRCVQYIESPDDMETISGDVPIHFRDYSKEKPVNDQTFEIFLRQFNYDKTDLNEHVEYLKTDNKDISFERI
ncbi:MAG: formylglycine-generating enzyme family protein, partial [Cyclobacteriaceae bacterium]|nr:formylglycine-generating enzyme family protein [Cyclobacteriaceae bacterium]